MRLNYKMIGQHSEVLVVLHGLMGMLDNWHAPAREYAEHFSVFLVDARNHGHSEHSSAHSYELMMQDLYEFLVEHGLDEVNILGHSMGGKTAMKFAQNHPEFVKKLVVADIAPKAYPVHHQQILKALRSIDFSKAERRSQVEEQLKSDIPEWGVRQFLLKNIYWKEKGKLAFRFNLDAIESNIERMGEEIADQMFRGPSLFIRGAESNYIQDSDWKDIELAFPNAQLKTIEGAGHWLHADKPEAFNSVLLDFLLE